jgi:hypothetical protein
MVFVHWDVVDGTLFFIVEIEDEAKSCKKTFCGSFLMINFYFP